MMKSLSSDFILGQPISAEEVERQVVAESAPKQADGSKAGARRKALSATSNELLTEDHAALEFARLYSDRLKFDHDAGVWREWSGSVWKENRTGLAFHWARELVRDLAARAEDRVRYVSSKTSFAAGVERFVRFDPIFARTSEFWDRDPLLIGTQQGVVDLRTGLLRAGDPKDGITKAAAVAPAKHADCPRWLQFLDEATGHDAEMVRFLRQWSGYCLSGDTREHALVFIFGPGGNGKSVFVNVLTGILGDYAATAAMDVFVASSADRHPTDLAMLRGARLVTASETEEGRLWAEARIKQLTGGDVISARFMRQDFFSFKPQFKLTITGNHKPSLHSVDDAQRRRFNLVPFTRKPASPDPQLEEKLKAEWPAILRWMINGALDWQRNGLVRPTSVLDATAGYFADQDLVGQWIDEECDAEPGNSYRTAPSGELFKSWISYAARAGEKAGSQKSFAETMQRRGFQRKKGTGGTREFVGIRLKPERSYADRDED